VRSGRFVTAAELSRPAKIAGAVRPALVGQPEFPAVASVGSASLKIGLAIEMQS